MKSEIFGCPHKCRGGGTSYVRYMGMWRPNNYVDFTHTQIGEGWSYFDPSPKRHSETWVKWVENWVLRENLWKMGIKSEQKLGKSLNKHGFPFSWECVRVLWRSWPHIVKLNEWTSVTAIIILVNYCPMIMQAYDSWVPTHFNDVRIYNLIQMASSGGGFLVQRSIRGRAAEMGLKISLLV